MRKTMFVISLVCAIFCSISCIEPSKAPEGYLNSVEQGHYEYDGRTGFCFWVYGNSTSAYSVTNVSCTDTVLTLAGVKFPEKTK